MHPTLVQIGPITVSTYGFVLALAFILALALAMYATKHSLRRPVPMTETQLIDWGCWAIVGGILGGRLFYVVLNWEVYGSRPQEILAIWHGGLVWYGGFVGGAFASWAYLRRCGIAFLQGADQVVPFVALGHAIGRLGCFFNGCCLGVSTNAWFGVRFPHQLQRLIPTQLLESASLLVLYLLLRSLQTSKALRPSGTLFGVYLAGYGLIRFSLEFYRADQPLLWKGLTLHQLISLAVLMTGLALIITKAKHTSISSQQRHQTSSG